MHNSTTVWYVLINDIQIGPITEETLEARYRAGEIRDEALVWTPGQPAWLPLADIGTLLHLITERHERKSIPIPIHHIKAADLTALIEAVDKSLGDFSPPAPPTGLATLKITPPDERERFTLIAKHNQWKLPVIGGSSAIDRRRIAVLFALVILVTLAILTWAYWPKVDATNVVAKEIISVLPETPDVQKPTIEKPTKKSSTTTLPKENAAIKKQKPKKKKAATTNTDPLTRDEIVKGVKGGKAGIVACTHTAKSKGARQGSYTLKLGWFITPTGRLKMPQVKAPSQLKGSGIELCVQKKMRSWRFRKTGKAVPVTAFPLKISVP